MDAQSQKLPMDELIVMTRAKDGSELMLKSKGPLGPESYFTYRAFTDDDGGYHIEISAFASFSTAGTVLQLINDDEIIEREKR